MARLPKFTRLCWFSRLMLLSTPLAVQLTFASPIWAQSQTSATADAPSDPLMSNPASAPLPAEVGTATALSTSPLSAHSDSPVPLIPSRSPPLSPLRDELRQHADGRRRNGIGLLVAGYILQFSGVSMLVPAVWHGSTHDSAFPVIPLGASGGFLTGVGNVLEIVGWTFFVKGNREIEILRSAQPQFMAVSASRGDRAGE